MSKAKRIRQANRRAATVHLYTVKQGLASCPGCPTCSDELPRLAEASRVGGAA